MKPTDEEVKQYIDDLRTLACADSAEAFGICEALCWVTGTTFEIMGGQPYQQVVNIAHLAAQGVSSVAKLRKAALDAHEAERKNKEQTT